MAKSKLIGSGDAEVIAMLKRYKCPTQFHEVRTRFLGNIASPVAGASPLETVTQLWGGDLPEIESIDDLNELLNVLVNGLWNRLTEHQNSRNPFMLVRFDVVPTRQGLQHFVLVRRQELDGFVTGLFGNEQQIELPERANEVDRSFCFCEQEDHVNLVNVGDYLFSKDIHTTKLTGYHDFNTI